MLLYEYIKTCVLLFEYPGIQFLLVDFDLSSEFDLSSDLGLLLDFGLLSGRSLGSRGWGGRGG